MVVMSAIPSCVQKAATRRDDQRRQVLILPGSVTVELDGFTAFINAANSTAKPSGLSGATHVLCAKNSSSSEKRMMWGFSMSLQ